MTIDLTSMPIAANPRGFTEGLTGHGEPVHWQVLEDPSAPGGRVIAETSCDTADYRFPLCIYDGLIAKDVAVSVRFKAVDGVGMKRVPASLISRALEPRPIRRQRLVTRSRVAVCSTASAGEELRFARDSPLEGDGFELPVPRVLEPSQFIRLLDTAFAFCRRDRRRIGDRSHLPQAERIGWAPDRCRLHTIQIWSRSLFTHLLGRAM
jgi:hypothetical protein